MAHRIGQAGHALRCVSARHLYHRMLCFTYFVKSSIDSLISAFDYAWARLTTRLVGLTDSEYFWEPVQGCWTLREAADGRWKLDGGGGGGPAPDPVPITTIGWRLCHLGGLALGGLTDLRFGDGTLTAEAIDFPTRADEVHPFLELRYMGWRDAIQGLSETEWNEPLGPAWDEYANDNTFDLALHVLDEMTHHGAEVGLLRDLYSQRESLI
jgi:DinB superfamily